MVYLSDVVYLAEASAASRSFPVFNNPWTRWLFNQYLIADAAARWLEGRGGSEVLITLFYLASLAASLIHTLLDLELRDMRFAFCQHFVVILLYNLNRPSSQDVPKLVSRHRQ